MLPRILKSALNAITGKRGFDAAAGGGRWAGSKRVANLNAEILAGRATIQQRAAYFARNNHHAAAASNALVTNIIGTGIKPSSQHPDKEVRKLLHALWSRWVDDADVEGGGDFYALQSLSVRQVVEAGESFAVFVPAPNLEVPFQVQLIHPDQLASDLIGDLTNNRVRSGIELGGHGERVAYHFYENRLNDPFAPLAGGFKTVRVAASEVCHTFERLEPGQLRGVSWFTPVLLALKELDAIHDAALVRAKLANLVVGALIDPDGSGLGGEQDGDIEVAGLEPGTMLNLPPGKSVEFFDPKESVNFGPFVKNHLHAVAAGIGIPTELLTGDLSQVNYSSIRAGLVEFGKRLDHWQHNTVAYRLCRPTWRRFIDMAVLSGAIPYAAFSANPAGLYAVEWLPPKRPWVDPQKDANAEILLIKNRLKSRSEVVAGMGRDLEALDAEIAMDTAVPAPADTGTAP